MLEMDKKRSYSRSIQGIMKFVTIVLIFLTSGLGTYAHLQSKYTKCLEKVKPLLSVPYSKLNNLPGTSKEIYFVIVTLLCFFLSLGNLAFHSCKPRAICKRKRVSIFDFSYHIISTCLLATAGFLMILSAVDLYGINCTSDNHCQLYLWKIVAGIMAMVTGMFYSTVGFLVILLEDEQKTSQNNEFFYVTGNPLNKY